MAEIPIALAAYTMDSHNVQRYIDAEGFVRNEGDVEVHGFPPYPIDYRAIIPRAGECENVAVPVCLSASHIAYGSIRMEPVFMILGQSAATACAHAIDEGKSLQAIDPVRLRERLLADGQILSWKNTGGGFVPPLAVSTLRGVVVDDDATIKTGAWKKSTSTGPWIGSAYLHDDNSNKGNMSADFVARLESPGKYRVRLAYTAHQNRAGNVPVVVRHKAGESRFLVDMRIPPPKKGAFIDLGVFDFAAGDARVTVANEGTNGYVVLDALQFLPVK